MKPNFRMGDIEKHNPRGGGLFAPALMPEEEKLDLARSILFDIGVTHVNQRGYELIHSCPLPFGSHKNGDINASASFNYDKLTFNCLGCGSSGGLLWFLETCRGDSPEKAREWLEEKSGLTDSPESLANLLRYLEAVFDEKKSAREPIPKMDARLLDKWKFIHPWVTEVRRIPEETVKHFTVGFGTVTLFMPDETFFDSQRIVIPHFWKGDLVGWQTRRLADDGTPKYSSSPSFPKDQTMFNHAGNASRAIVVESPFSVLSKFHVTPEIEATFGAKVTDIQLDILSRHEQVTLWMDNDPAGWKATHRIGEFLTDHCPVFVVPSLYDADPADLDDETYLELLDQRIPYALWQDPGEDDLIPWSYPEGGLDGLQEIRSGQDSLAGAER